ncbi:MAG TPA: hypothetical protein VGL99_26395, partial [Chloroflexota bacterium]
IRLGQVAQVATVTGPTQISRRDRQRSVTVSAGLDGTPSGEVSQRVQARWRRALAKAASGA